MTTIPIVQQTSVIELVNANDIFIATPSFTSLQVDVEWLYGDVVWIHRSFMCYEPTMKLFLKFIFDDI